MPPTKYKFVQAPPGYPGKMHASNGRIFEHYFVWWKNTGFLPAEGKELHHKNLNRMDNRFENLEEVTPSDHTRLHNPKRPDVEVKCAFCGCKLMRSARDVQAKSKAGQTRFFCSPSHAAQMQNQEDKGRRRGIHGTGAMYNLHGCRCEACRAYKAAQYRKSARFKGT